MVVSIRTGTTFVGAGKDLNKAFTRYCQATKQSNDKYSRAWWRKMVSILRGQEQSRQREIQRRLGEPTIQEQDVERL